VVLIEIVIVRGRLLRLVHVGSHHHPFDISFDCEYNYWYGMVWYGMVWYHIGIALPPYLDFTPRRARRVEETSPHDVFLSKQGNYLQPIVKEVLVVVYLLY